MKRASLFVALLLGCSSPDLPEAPIQDLGPTQDVGRDSDMRLDLSTPDASQQPDATHDADMQVCSSICGDLTGSGSITEEDLQRLLEMALGERDATACDVEVGDIDRNGVIDETDVLLELSPPRGLPNKM